MDVTYSRRRRPVYSIPPEKCQWFVYSLKDPRTSEIRYIGVTRRSPEERLRGHIAAARQGGGRHTLHWIKSILDAGMTPEMEIVEQGIGEGYQEAEIRQILEHKARGCRLTNLTIGGDGTVGRRWTDEERVRASRQRKGVGLGRKMPEASIIVGSAKRTGLKRTPEQRLRMSLSAKRQDLRQTVWSRENVTRLYLTENKPIEDIAKEIKTTTGSLYNLLDEYGIAHRRNPKLDLPKPVSLVAKKLGISEVTVYRYLRGFKYMSDNVREAIAREFTEETKCQLSQ